MENLERQVIRGVVYTRVIRLDGRGDHFLNNDRMFTLNRETLVLTCAYDTVDMRDNGRNIDSPWCDAGPGVICGHILAPHALAYMDFWRALRLALYYLLAYSYSSLLKAEVDAVFRAIKVEFFGICQLSLQSCSDCKLEVGQGIDGVLAS
jgi:hypothetical protein